MSTSRAGMASTAPLARFHVVHGHAQLPSTSQSSKLADHWPKARSGRRLSLSLKIVDEEGRRIRVGDTSRRARRILPSIPA
ncbi:MAG: hypothetical protein U5K56_18130 [Halioglobus sp.]|nr:hypothetical protein [Halioglobus sp.]